MKQAAQKLSLSLLALLFFFPLNVKAEVGVAYQIWNQGLGLWQTKEQLEYDLSKMHQSGIKSLRVEFVWGMIEPKPGVYNFSLSDHLIARAKYYGIKLYPIIGFQWPPRWFFNKRKLGFFSREDPNKIRRSPFMNYADPYVIKRFVSLISTVVERYKGEKTIGAWILGNEFTYTCFTNVCPLGYDKLSTELFQGYLQKKYGTIRTLNQRWKIKLANYQAITPDLYRIKERKDVIQPPQMDFLNFRRHAIADLIGKACEATKKADPEAQWTYASIGGLYSQYDQLILSEDVELIAQKCAERGAPLSFFSLNAYLNLNSRQSFHLGILQKIAAGLTKLPIVFTEFGLSSTEIYSNIRVEKQAYYLVAQYLETIIDKLEKSHIFTWVDKKHVAPRERGFGLHTEDRKPKPSWKAIQKTMGTLKDIDILKLQSEIVTPKKHAAILLPDPEIGYVHWNSYLNEVWLVASRLARLDVPLRFITTQDLYSAKELDGVELLILARQEMLEHQHLAHIQKLLKKNQFHLLALSGLPGEEAKDRNREEWTKQMEELFGIITFKREDSIYGPLGPIITPSFSTLSPDDNTKTIATSSFRTSKVYHIEKIDKRSRNIYMLNSTDPFVVSHSHGKKLALFVTTGLGHVAHLSDQKIHEELSPLIKKQADKAQWRIEKNPGNFIVQALEKLLAKDLGLRYLIRTPYQEPVKFRNIRIQKIRSLQKGGKIAFFSALPRLTNEKKNYDCPKWEEQFITQEKTFTPREELLSLITGKKYRADSSGRLTYSLKACHADLIISKNSLPRMKKIRTTMSTLKKPNLPPRGVLFPTRVWTHSATKNWESSCFIQKLKDLGYKGSYNTQRWEELTDGVFVPEDTISKKTPEDWSRHYGAAYFPTPEKLASRDFVAIKRYRDLGGEIIFGKDPRRKDLRDGDPGITVLQKECRSLTKQKLADILKRG